MTIKGLNIEAEDKQAHVVTWPQRGHHVINNGVKKICRDIIKRFVDNFGINCFRGNNYVNLVEQNIINEVNRGVLPVDCVLRTAPLPHATESEIENNTMYNPRGEKYTNYKNAEEFGQAKEVLLVQKCKAVERSK